MSEILKVDAVKQNDLEVYYNGDETLTEFRIKCYERRGNCYNYIGIYTPDFLLIQRKNGKIYKALIVETKGKLYSRDRAFAKKRQFTETDFLQKNNELFGYKKFNYLYLEDSMTDKERIIKTANLVEKFFTEQ